MQIQNSTLLFIFALAISACGGSGGAINAPTETVGSSTVSNAGLEFTVTRVESTGVISFDPNPSTDSVLTFEPSETLNVDGFEGLSAEGGAARYMRRATDNGVVAIILSDADLSEGFTGSIAARSSDANIPLQGSASYEGPYAAFLDGGDLSAFGDTVTGTVEVAVNFQTGALGGSISDRQTTQGSELSNLDFSGGFIVNPGALNGVVASDARPLASAIGSTTVFVLGADANELAGITEIQHSFEDGHPLGERAVLEIGGFLLSED